MPWRQLWQYLAERFPLQRTLPLLLVFSAASINVSAGLGGRSLPDLWAYVLAFLLAIIVFFQLRAADEWKDRDIDARYRPERPIPRGLIELELILAIASGLVPVAVLLVLPFEPAMVGLLAMVWCWMAAMTVEFGARDWLVARPLAYMLSHMAIMPFIDLMLTGVEWVGRHAPSPDLWIFLALSLVNGCVLEIGRKCWSPSSEREGVDSYSRAWGTKRAALVWAATVLAAAFLLVLLGRALGHPNVFATVAVIGAVGAMVVAQGFRADPSPEKERRIDAAAGLWVLACYATAGFAPLLAGALS